MSQARKNRRRNWRSGSRADELSLHGVPTSIWRVPWRFVGFLGGFTLHALGVKLDGFRMMVRRDPAGVRLITRNGRAGFH
jgi:hypothetical protein